MELHALTPLISIGGLPTEAEMNALFQRGVKSLINVSGIKLSELYPEQLYDCWDLNEYFFSDIFSKDQDTNALDSSLNQPERFIATANPLHKEQFLQSVRAASRALRQHESVHIFCHHGVGRSPVVTLAAICQVWQMPLSKAIALVENLRPQCRITAMSVAASRWIDLQNNSGAA
jgi:hypothetical protein